MTVYRLEFLQPDGRWTGPYCAEWMTPAAFALRDRMLPAHKNSPYHRFPDAEIFVASPGRDRYVCGTISLEKLELWFGDYFGPFLDEGGHVGIYEVPAQAIALDDGTQIVYQQRQAVLLQRNGLGSPSRLALVERIHPAKVHM